MAGNGSLSIPFAAKLDRMKQGEIPVDIVEVERMGKVCSMDSDFPLTIGLELLKTGQVVEAIGYFRQAREILLRQLEINPDDQWANKKLEDIHSRLEKAEIRLG